MRLAIILAAAALLAAPAFAQRVVPAPVVPPEDQAPPPEGFYKDIPNMYDLLARPMALGNVMMINGRRICPAAPHNLTDEQRKSLTPCRTEKVAGPFVPQVRRKP